MPFRLPEVQSKVDGWGPAVPKLANVLEECLPTELRNVPYAPFNKNDRLGRVAELASSTGGIGGRRGHDGQDGGRGRGRGGFNAMFAYHHVEDESSFQFVEGGTKGFAVRKMGQRPHRGGPRNPRERGGSRGGGSHIMPSPTSVSMNMANMSTRQPSSKSSVSRPVNKNTLTTGMSQVSLNPNAQQRKPKWTTPYSMDRFPRLREYSIETRPEWKVLEEIDFTRLGKLHYEVDEPQDLVLCGAVGYYDRIYDSISSKNERPLMLGDRNVPRITASEDPLLQKFANEGVGNVFATDVVIAALMTCPRSFFAWDLVFNRVGEDKLFIDKRDGSTFDYVTVNETAQDLNADERESTVNSPSALMFEATAINHNFLQQMCNSEERYSFPNEHPFPPSILGGKEDEQDPTTSTRQSWALIGYRYRKWELGSKMNLIIRTEVDGVMKQQNQDVFLSIKALNESDSRLTPGAVDWRQKIDTQRGLVLATEMKNNGFKMARWIVQALLGGVEQIKIGYVARANPKDNTRHIVLATQSYKPREFAVQMNLNMSNGWGIVKSLIDVALRLPEGKYMLVKDPSKPIMRLYDLPMATGTSIHPLETMGMDSVSSSVVDK